MRSRRTFDGTYITLYSSRTLKAIRWLGSTREDVQGFPRAARVEIGHELYQVQQGLLPSDWRPMSSVGVGVVEVRVHVGQEFRVLYLARREEAVYVLHAFEKRTRKTRQVDLEVARKRLRDLNRSRKAE